MASQMQAQVDELLAQVAELEKTGLKLYDGLDFPEKTTMDDITSVVQQVLAEHEKLITGIQDNGLSNINVADMGSTPTDNVEAMVKAVRTATDASNKDIQSVTSRLSRANTLLAKPIIPST